MSEVMSKSSVAMKIWDGAQRSERSERSVEPSQAPAAGRGEDARVPDPEVVEKAKRRHFSARYKLRILRQADACERSGELGALLRREGLYWSNLQTWRRQREQGTLEALKPKKRGRKAAQRNPLSAEVKRLERENRQLKRKLEQVEIMLEIQKKVSELLEIPLAKLESEGDDS